MFYTALLPEETITNVLSGFDLSRSQRLSIFISYPLDSGHEANSLSSRQFQSYRRSAYIGNVAVTINDFPSFVVAFILPPCAVTIAFAIDKPMP